MSARVDDTASPAVVEPTRVRPGTGPPPHVLLIDDEATLAELVRRRLEGRGFRVSVATSGEEGLSLIGKDRSIVALVLDVMMPGIGGEEVLRTIRLEHPAERLPAIMLTARSDAAVTIRCLEAGANDFVTKPADMDVLAARLRAHLDRRAAQDALARSEERYSLALRGSHDVIWDWDVLTDRMQYSDRWSAVFLKDAPPGTGAETLSRVHEADRSRCKLALEAVSIGLSDDFHAEVRFAEGEGWRWVRFRGAGVRDSAGRLRRLAGSLSDFRHPQVHDEVTGLPNRVLFSEFVDAARARAVRNPGATWCVMVVRFDGIVALAGEMLAPYERLVATVGRALVACLRDTDRVGSSAATPSSGVASLGSGDFSLLCEQLSGPADALRIARRISERFADGLDGATAGTRVVPRIGIAMGRSGMEGGSDALLSEAVLALHRAGAGGGEAIFMSDGELQRTVGTRLRFESDLHRAIVEGGLRLEYQPVVALSSGRAIGTEALVRWTHPQSGNIGPDRFISVAEESGLIVPLGRWVIEHAVAQAALWGPSRPLRLALNLSPKQLLLPDLPEQLLACLTGRGISPERVELELTEGVFMSNPEGAGRALERLRGLGLRIALDDFGTGFSSLGYLRRFRVDTLKIDRTFVSGLPGDPTAVAIAQTILGMARSFGLDVVAEGVETAEQATFLRDAGCDYAQGWYFSRSVPPDDLGAALERSDAQFERLRAPA